MPPYLRGVIIIAIVVVHVLDSSHQRNRLQYLLSASGKLVLDIRGVDFALLCLRILPLFRLDQSQEGVIHVLQLM